MVLVSNELHKLWITIAIDIRYTKVNNWFIPKVWKSVHKLVDSLEVLGVGANNLVCPAKQVCGEWN